MDSGGDFLRNILKLPNVVTCVDGVKLIFLGIEVNSVNAIRIVNLVEDVNWSRRYKRRSFSSG
jgi:hypothetical protein